jgi:DNA-binding HxlR family transcriptional regulator
VHGTFFFRRGNKNFNEIIDHDPLEFWLMPQLSEDKRNVFQHDSVPPHIYTELTRIGSRLCDVLAKWGPLSGLKYYQDIA